ncbi:ABC transporter permease [uncultured Methanocorpusculum sp.]|nr:ABC transporter permease [uncultured Methanocorpusculum sp.]
MTYLDQIVIIVAFGAASVSFLWLRDTRIFVRTGKEGYRKAAYHGVLYSALGWFGFALAGFGETTFMYLGVGCVLIALYLQSRLQKEDVWVGNESAWTRFIGSAPRQERK